MKRLLIDLTEFKKCFLLLERNDSIRIIVVSIAQFVLGIVDLAGVSLFGALGALAVSGVQSKEPIEIVEKLLDLLNLQSFTFQKQVAVLGMIAASLLTARTLLSILLTRKLLVFLGSRGSELSTKYVDKLLISRFITIKKRNSQEVIYAVTHGVVEIMIGVIGVSISALSDLFLLIIIILGLLLFSPWMALTTVMMFILFALIVSKSLHNRARNLGRANSLLNIKSNTVLMEAFFGYREILTKGRIPFYSSQISEVRRNIGVNYSELSFLPYVGKYVIESITIIGILVVSAIQFLTTNAVKAISSLSFFLASMSRIAPAALRLQQSILTIRSTLGSTEITLNLIGELENFGENLDSKELNGAKEAKEIFVPHLIVSNLNFKYPGETRETLNSISFEVNPGESLGIIGPSGSGKSTLVDLVLGVLPTKAGSIEISGADPFSAIKLWPGEISYVPQEPYISDSTLIENIAMGFPPKEINIERVNTCIELASLSGVVKELDGGLNFQVGERGSKLSGGQRQRLAIARALYTNPSLVILDEATSALDEATEEEITKAIERLKGIVTLVVISHRLSVVKNLDSVIVLESGKILEHAPFSQLNSTRKGITQK